MVMRAGRDPKRLGVPPLVLRKGPFPILVLRRNVQSDRASAADGDPETNCLSR